MRVRSITIAFFLLGALLAAQPPAPEKIRAQGYVTDLAGVVTPDWKQRIEQLCAELDSKTQSQMAVVTIRSLDGEPIEDYANRWLRAWGVGRKTNKGALMLLVIEDKRMRLEVGYGLEPVVPDGFAGEVMRGMRDGLGRRSYGEAIFGGVNVVAQRIAEQAGVKLDGSAGVRRVRRVPQPNSWPILLKILFFILIIAVMSGRYWFLGPLIGGGWSGGGFGGSGGGGGGGGGFGGFGGGDSGGGGASSSW